MPGLKRKLFRTDFHQLADDRMADARTLLTAGRAVAAYYIAGYAIECALKACIARTVGEHKFPDKDLGRNVHTHRLDDLLGFAGLRNELRDASQQDPQLATNWAIAANWSETVRYYGATVQDAEELIAAVDDPQHGILEWIKQRW